MEARRKKRNPGAKGAILARCPLCKGKGEVPRELPFLANPKAPATRADKMGLKTCSKCHGSGIIGSK